MPPPDSGHHLSKQQIAMLRQWIQQGATYETHWAFEPPVAGPLPEVEGSSWCRQEMDYFVLQKMRAEQLSPAKRAQPAILIRRLYLDLIGLPPTPAQADAFLQNPSAAAYTTIVDQLLDSPRYGEHWARMWLDLARYADTKGYEKDQAREIWRYRDWVISALNDDLSYDQFTTQQLAGDLLAEPTIDQLLATAFHRNTMTNDEGGTDNEEFRLAAVKDRVDTTVQVWMGLTMGCAKCHSHKYDPINQREYYQFLAYFNQTEDADRPDDAPRVPTPTPEQTRASGALSEQIDQSRLRLKTVTPEMVAAQRKWESKLLKDPTWQVAKPAKATSLHGSTLTLAADGAVLASGEMPPRDVYTVQIQPQQTAAITALRLEMLTHDSLPQKGPGRNPNDPNFVLSELKVSVTNAAGDAQRLVKLKQAKADFSQQNWPVAKAIDGNPETGWAISPQKSRPHVAIFALAEPLTLQAGERLECELSQQYAPTSLLIGRVRLATSAEPFASLQPVVADHRELAAIPLEQRTAAQKQQLEEAFRQVYPATAAEVKRLKQLEAEFASLQKQIVKTPIMRDLPADKHRKSHIHERGNFLNPGEEVSPGFPAAFAIKISDPRNNRLDVAQWLTSPDNPLTARVMVNRVWARLFGRGIVETEEDFGLQGSPPTHPELLDHLAIKFREEQHWSIKQLIRAIVLSATYQQDSTVSDASRERDATNRWLSRGARFRLPAEVVRDQSLAAAGLLSGKIGGPSVMPPQPDGIWRATYSKLRWVTSTGEDRYRRGLYTYVRRTSPYPSMLTFDAGTREVCQLRRVRTNTPLQALVVLNDPVYVEAAGALANAFRDMAPGDAMAAMFRRVLIRKPSARETQRLLALYEEILRDYRAAPEDARQLLESAQLKPQEDAAALAARIVVGNVILNLDETFTRP
ncbi:MAG TPA: hypothetical protein DCY79_14670 [Planctomycetaceae bacterium]|nr:hypothetical protein [Planctomycetaceae bacterium]